MISLNNDEIVQFTNLIKLSLSNRSSGEVKFDRILRSLNALLDNTKYFNLMLSVILKSNYKNESSFTGITGS